MCGRYVLAQKIEVIEKRFNVTAQEGLFWEPNYNIVPGAFVPVIASNNPNQIQLFRFGLRPHWSGKNLLLINARAEGDRNAENDPLYKGSRDIINKPAFRKPIRTQRCLIPADCFIEGTTEKKLNEPYVVYLRNKIRPFAFAGIWDAWIDNETKTALYSFAIITTTANKVMQLIPYHRSPVILYPSQEKRWVNTNTPLSEITGMLEPFDWELMNAYRISPEIKNPKNYGRQLIDPIGATIMPAEDIKLADILKRRGFGRK